MVVLTPQLRGILRSHHSDCCFGVQASLNPNTSKNYALEQCKLMMLLIHNSGSNKCFYFFRGGWENHGKDMLFISSFRYGPNANSSAIWLRMNNYVVTFTSHPTLVPSFDKQPLSLMFVTNNCYHADPPKCVHARTHACSLTLT